MKNSGRYCLKHDLDLRQVIDLYYVYYYYYYYYYYYCLLLIVIKLLMLSFYRKSLRAIRQSLSLGNIYIYRYGI